MILAVILIATLIGLVALWAHFAPFGYEDETGFHYGSPLDTENLKLPHLPNGTPNRNHLTRRT